MVGEALGAVRVVCGAVKELEQEAAAERAEGEQQTRKVCARCRS